jgi:hypothetical protein
LLLDAMEMQPTKFARCREAYDCTWVLYLSTMSSEDSLKPATPDDTNGTGGATSCGGYEEFCVGPLRL